MHPYRLFHASGVEEATVNLPQTISRGIHPLPLPWTLMQAERLTITLHRDGELIVEREIYLEDSPQQDNAPTATPSGPETPSA